MEKISLALNAVLSAWMIHGHNEEYHMKAKLDLKEKWPSLYYALIQLESATRE